MLLLLFGSVRSICWRVATTSSSDGWMRHRRPCPATMPWCRYLDNFDQEVLSLQHLWEEWPLMVWEENDRTWQCVCLCACVCVCVYVCVCPCVHECKCRLFCYNELVFVHGLVWCCWEFPLLDFWARVWKLGKNKDREEDREIERVHVSFSYFSFSFFFFLV